MLLVTTQGAADEMQDKPESRKNNKDANQLAHDFKVRDTRGGVRGSSFDGRKAGSFLSCLISRSSTLGVMVGVRE